MPEPMASSSTTCPACGAVLPPGVGECQTLFDELLAREFTDYRYARLHRLTVDTYSLQHPERYMRSPKSFAAHLTGMCAAMEGEGADAVNGAVQRWLNGPRAIERPDDVPAGRRGALTVIYVHQAADADDYLRRVQEWARSTWAAWETHHAIARKWIEQAGGGGG